MVDEDRARVLSPGDDEVGWLAQAGRVPLGYLGDPVKTEATFPTVEGTRYSVAGDRARWRADGAIELLGREAACINTGGEKVFAEEVELALAHHPGVADCLVVGRPHERFGNEVVAVVAVRPGAEVDLEGLRAAAADHLAGYKLPRALVLVDAGLPLPQRQARLRLGPPGRHRRRRRLTRPPDPPPEQVPPLPNCSLLPSWSGIPAPGHHQA